MLNESQFVRLQQLWWRFCGIKRAIGWQWKYSFTKVSAVWREVVYSSDVQWTNYLISRQARIWLFWLLVPFPFKRLHENHFTPPFATTIGKSNLWEIWKGWKGFFWKVVFLESVLFKYFLKCFFWKVRVESFCFSSLPHHWPSNHQQLLLRKKEKK